MKLTPKVSGDAVEVPHRLDVSLGGGRPRFPFFRELTGLESLLRSFGVCHVLYMTKPTCHLLLPVVYNIFGPVLTWHFHFLLSPSN